MGFYKGHTKAGSALTELILQSFRLHGSLMDSGERLVRPLGLTAARWQVISSIARAPQTGPVSHIARDMGLARQSVQRLAGALAADGFLEYRDNPNHKRAPLVVLTSRGREAFEAATQAQVGWANSLATDMDPQDIGAALALLSKLERRLQST
jgi:DNA-binding MarR family transcriptional regulator